MFSLRRPSREDLAAIATVIGIGLLITVSLYYRAWDRQRSTNTVLSDRQLATALPRDSALLEHTYSNGLRYFIQKNSFPNNRAELRLVVNVGSVLETQEQRGLAHAVEHMVFRGTKSFPGHAIDDYLHSIGMRPGEDVNAYTSTDETVYNITVPTDRPGALDTAMCILAEMAHEATFDAAEARVEAGVVFEEWRSRQGVGARFQEQRNALLLAGSQYPQRAPIGDTAVLRKFDVTELRRFYKDWYRPDLMGVVVVGDFEQSKVRNLVNKYFGKIPSGYNQKKRQTFSVPLTDTVRAATLTDVEATDTRISLLFPHSKSAFKTIGDYRSWAISELWREVLATRLEDVADAPGSPILSASTDSYNPARPIETEVVSATISEKSALRAVDLLVTEVARLLQHGLTERELTQHTEAFLKLQWRQSEWDASSSELADNYASQFVSGDAVLPHRDYSNLAERIIPTIRPSDVLTSARTALRDSSALIIVTQPHDRAPVGFTPGKLIEQVRVAAGRVVAPPAELPDSVKLVSTLPTPGKIINEITRREIEVSELTLSNGMHVLLKPTNFTTDHIEFRMTGSGGASLANSMDYESAFLADAVVASTGFGPLNGTRLDRLLNASSLSFSQSVSNSAISFSGEVAPRDIEQFFQVLYLNFTAPRADTVAFRRFRERMLASAAHRSSNPQEVFEDSAIAVSTQHDRRALRYASAFYNAVTLPKALAFWNARMTNASNFTLVMTGDFTMTRVRPLIELYLASLPAGKSEQPVDDGIRFPSGIVEKTIYAGVGPAAKTRIMLSGPIDYTMATSERIGMVSDLAELALGNKLRETMGGTYGVQIGYGVNLVAPSTYQFDIEFEGAPERIDSLSAAALAELKRLVVSGPTAAELEKVRNTKTRGLDNVGESNRYWANELMQHARRSWPLDSITTHQDRIKQISAEALRQACAQFLDTTHFVRVTMYPKQPALKQRPH